MFKKMDYVYAVYKEKSFTKAAEKLYVSQPCLSAAIKKIEDEIGVSLFERRYSSVRPTKIGLEYISAVERIKAIEQDFASKIQDTDSLQYGSITIGGTNYVISYILPHIIKEFSKLYPKIEINLIETKSVELERMLIAEEIDLFIDSFDLDEFAQECFPLLNEKILVAVPKAFKCNHKLEEYVFSQNDNSNPSRKVSIRSFKDENFILLKSGNNMYKHATHIFKEAGITPNVSYKLDQLSTSYNLVKSECGICFLPDTIFKYNSIPDNIALYHLEESKTRTLYVVKKKNKFFSSAMKKFIEISQQTIK